MLLCYPVPVIQLPSAREVDVAWRQQPRCVTQALTFPTNAFLRSSQDICWPWRVLKQCGFPGPLCGFSSYRKIYARISALFSSCFVLVLAHVHYACREPITVQSHGEIRWFRGRYTGTSYLASEQCPVWRDVSAQQEFTLLCFLHKLGGFLSTVGLLRGFLTLSPCQSLLLYHIPSNTTCSLTCCRLLPSTHIFSWTQ